MTSKYRELAFTPSVREAQVRFGARQPGTESEAAQAGPDRLSAAEVEFISERDSFYMASVNEDGWPYVQFRGGPQGFLRVLDDGTLGYADFRGNMQYLSTGNVSKNDRVSLFFMDYANRRRLKLMAHTRVIPAGEQPELAAQLEDPTYDAHVERIVLFDVVAFDWNCPQHITPRFSEAELAALGR